VYKTVSSKSVSSPSPYSRRNNIPAAMEAQNDVKELKETAAFYEPLFMYKKPFCCIDLTKRLSHK
jgi:hypothetical protein